MTREEIAAAIRNATNPQLSDDPAERAKTIDGDRNLLAALTNPTHKQMTPREREVLQAAANGLTQQESARELHMSVSTVNEYRQRAIARLDARNITHAVALMLATEGPA